MRYVHGFLRFWYDFIVGDDWRIAAGVSLMLAFGAVLVATRLALAVAGPEPPISSHGGTRRERRTRMSGRCGSGKVQPGIGLAATRDRVRSSELFERRE